MRHIFVIWPDIWPNEDETITATSQSDSRSVPLSQNSNHSSPAEGNYPQTHSAFFSTLVIISKAPNDAVSQRAVFIIKCICMWPLEECARKHYLHKKQRPPRPPTPTSRPPLDNAFQGTRPDGSTAADEVSSSGFGFGNDTVANSPLHCVVNLSSKYMFLDFSSQQCEFAIFSFVTDSPDNLHGDSLLERGAQLKERAMIYSYSFLTSDRWPRRVSSSSVRPRSGSQEIMNR